MQVSLQPSTSSSRIFLILSAAVLGIASLWWRHFTPSTLLSPHLHALVDPSADQHLLTRMLWREYVQRTGFAASAIFNANLAALIVVTVGLVAYVVRSYARNSGLIGLLVCALIALNPMSLALLLDPLGAESALSLGAIGVLMLKIAMREKPLQIWQIAVLAGWIVFQEPTLIPAFLVGVFALGLLRKDRGAGIIGLVCLVAFILRIGIAFQTQGGLDSYSAPAGIIALGIFSFIVTPIAIYLLNNARLLDWLSESLWILYAMAVVLLASPSLPGATDVFLSWIAASFALVLAFIPDLRRQDEKKAQLALVIVTAAVLLLQFPLARGVALTPSWSREARNVTPEACWDPTIRSRKTTAVSMRRLLAR